ncbi:putative glycolipid-binding domain-containing protein [Amycolatopsis minnesotensis]|uniref:Glycolipid-binding domain-containing protein n=2 Tax=Amycolatopsis minnesotensis TaxID=337894 RepID=A0ABP5BTT0_9PSEU
MGFSAFPATAAWRHQGLRDGFEVVHFHRLGDGWRFTGCTTAVEEGQTWIVGYTITVDAKWATRRAEVRGHSATRVLEADGAGRWTVDGAYVPELDGCLDVDLESSAVTNTLPVHRLALADGATAEAPAAYVRARDLGVTTLAQTYRADGLSYDYRAPAFDFECRLSYDESGLVLDYPGIAVRAA